MTPDPLALAERARHVALRMIGRNHPAAYLRDDAISAAILGALSAAARGARNPMARANGAVRDLMRNELPQGWRRPKGGRDGMPRTMGSDAIAKIPYPWAERDEVLSPGEPCRRCNGVDTYRRLVMVKGYAVNRLRCRACDRRDHK